MKQTVYIDVLVGLNLIINYFLLLAVARILTLSFRRPRLVGGAALGAVCSLTILAPELNPALFFFVRLALSAGIVLAAFRWNGLKQFLRETAAFYLVSFAFAGFMLILWYLFSPQGMILKNSVVYFDVSPLTLIFFTVLCYLVVMLISRVTGRRAPKELYCRIRIDCSGRSCDCSAKVDTGNSLREPFSNYPVAVVYGPRVAAVAPEPDSLNMRLVPFSAVSGGGLLKAFRPDKLTVSCGGRTVEVHNVYIAVAPERLGECDALLNPDLLLKTTA
jgi:stage II sporulation protein GA (sporulation sigma-E factor processing peptidase)